MNFRAEEFLSEALGGGKDFSDWFFFVILSRREKSPNLFY